jgi:predicted RecB family endonuclease
MESWMVGLAVLAVNLLASFGAMRYASGKKDKIIADLVEKVEKLEAKTAGQATKSDVDRLIERLDSWANKIETDVRNVATKIDLEIRGVRGLLAQIVAEEKPTLAEILGTR